jgi:hypothetical protein
MRETDRRSTASPPYCEHTSGTSRTSGNCPASAPRRRPRSRPGPSDRATAAHRPAELVSTKRAPDAAPAQAGSHGTAQPPRHVGTHRSRPPPSRGGRAGHSGRKATDTAEPSLRAHRAPAPAHRTPAGCAPAAESRPPAIGRRGRGRQRPKAAARLSLPSRRSRLRRSRGHPHRAHAVPAPRLLSMNGAPPPESGGGETSLNFRGK